MFGVLSETLYNLLQLVNVSQHHTTHNSKALHHGFNAILMIHKTLKPNKIFENDCLSQDWEQRQEEDNLLIERILLLVRNVLHVPADPYEEKVRV